MTEQEAKKALIEEMKSDLRELDWLQACEAHAGEVSRLAPYRRMIHGLAGSARETWDLLLRSPMAGFIRDLTTSDGVPEWGLAVASTGARSSGGQELYQAKDLFQFEQTGGACFATLVLPGDAEGSYLMDVDQPVSDQGAVEFSLAFFREDLKPTPAIVLLSAEKTNLGIAGDTVELDPGELDLVAVRPFVLTASAMTDNRPPVG